jgi:hypothetical protein
MSPGDHTCRFFRLVTIIVGFATVAGAAFGQDSGWTAHTSFRQVQAIDASSDRIWSATTGGVFSYDIESGEIERYTAVDGMHGVSATTLAFDAKRHYVWVGYRDGVIDRLDIQTREIRSFLDIQRAQQFSSRGVNRILVHGDSLLISTDFGIVIFDPIQSEVRDTYSRLGDNSAATQVRDLVVAPDDAGDQRLWAATINGIASARTEASNLQDPAAWTNERAGFTEDSKEVRSLAYFRGSIYAGTTLDLYRRVSGGSYSQTGATTESVDQIYASDLWMVAIERFRLILVDTEHVVYGVAVDGYQDPTSVVVEPEIGIWAGDRQRGLVAVGNPDPFSGLVVPLYGVIPNGPYDGFFSDLHTTPDGALWAGGLGIVNSGFYRLGSDGIWTTYSGLFFDNLIGANRFTSVYGDLEDEAWAASEGAGVAHALPDGTVELYDISNSSLEPASGTQGFVIAAGITRDEGGNVWVTTMASQKPLHVRTATGEWRGFTPRIGDGLSSSSSAYNRIFNDSFGQKWIIVRDENNLSLTKGLMVLETGDVLDASDDEHRFFGEGGGSGQGLPSTLVTSVAEDRDGLIWVGTESGPAYFLNSGFIARDPSASAIWPQWADRTQGTFMLFGLRINDIAVDPANRLWFATGDGAWLVEVVEGGYRLVSHFTEENSPLFSNEVLSVAVDAVSGRVFLGTDQGLVSYDAGAVASSKSVQDLFVYPNPVRIENMNDVSVMIDGLVERTEIRILTVGGSLVRKLSGRGGRVSWDLEDESGRVVDSGVYIIAAVGQNGEGTAYGKVAVIR